jgi:putative ABC transport system substrate-binding protein
LYVRLLRSVVLAVLLGLAGRAGAGEVVILQSGPLQPFQEAVEAFKRALQAGIAHRGPRRVESVVFTDVTLTASEPDPNVARKVRSLKPDLVLATGTPALEALRDLKEIPIVYLMVHSSPAWVRTRSNITGVAMTITAEQWLDTIGATFPGRKRLGLVYDPRRTGDFVSEAKAAAARKGFSLVTREVSSSKEVHERIQELKGSVDVLWMLPDLTVVTPQSVESMMLFSLRNHIPVVTFSERHLDVGATAAVVLDFAAMGGQAGEMARRVLDGASVDLVPPEPPAKVNVRINRSVAEKLGVIIDVPRRTPENQGTVP